MQMPDFAKYEKLLRSYNNLQGQIQLLEIEIEDYKEFLRDAETEILDEYTSSGTVFRLIPIRRTRLPSDPLPKTHTVRENVEEAMIMASKRLAGCRRLIRIVDAYLAGLNENEKWVAQRFLIDGYTWAEVEKLAEKELPLSRSKDYLRATKKRLLISVSKMIENASSQG